MTTTTAELLEARTELDRVIRLAQALDFIDAELDARRRTNARTLSPVGRRIRVEHRRQETAR